jgi:hypothetical protein
VKTLGRCQSPGSFAVPPSRWGVFIHTHTHTHTHLQTLTVASSSRLLLNHLNCCRGFGTCPKCSYPTVVLKTVLNCSYRRSHTHTHAHTHTHTHTHTLDCRLKHILRLGTSTPQPRAPGGRSRARIPLCRELRRDLLIPVVRGYRRSGGMGQGRATCGADLSGLFSSSCRAGKDE